MTHDPVDTTPLHGPFKAQVKGGDAALFKDDRGNAVALMAIRPCMAVPVLMWLDPETQGDHPDPGWVNARCPLLSTPDLQSYRGWDDPVFRGLCASLGIDPDKQRPRYDAWCQEVGEALLIRALEALEDRRYDEHGAAGLAAEALTRGATPDTVNLRDVIMRTPAIADKALGGRTLAALQQLERSADWQEGQKRKSAAVIAALVGTASETGTPVTVVRNETGRGGALVFGKVDDDLVHGKPFWMPAWMWRLYR